MTKSDKNLIAFVLMLALLAYLIYFLDYQGTTPLTAEISVNGNTVAIIDLNNPEPYRLIDIAGPLGTSVAEVRPGAIRMKYSPCPDKYCIATAWIDRSGQFIACVPNRIIIKIHPDKNTIETTSI